MEGKYVTFTEADGGAAAPEWARVLLNGDVRILEMKEVRRVLLIRFGCISHHPPLGIQWGVIPHRRDRW